MDGNTNAPVPRTADGHGNHPNSRLSTTNNAQGIDAHGRTVAERLGSSLNTDITKSPANRSAYSINCFAAGSIPHLVHSNTGLGTPSKHKKHYSSSSNGNGNGSSKCGREDLDTSKCTTPSRTVRDSNASINPISDANTYTPPATAVSQTHHSRSQSQSQSQSQSSASHSPIPSRIASAIASIRSPSSPKKNHNHMSHRHLSVASISVNANSTENVENTENGAESQKLQQNEQNECVTESTSPHPTAPTEQSPYEKYGIKEHIPMTPYVRVATPPKPMVLTKVTQFHGKIDKFCVLNRRTGVYDNDSIEKATGSHCTPYLNDCVTYPPERYGTSTNGNTNGTNTNTRTGATTNASGLLKVSIVDDLVAEQQEQMDKAGAEHMMRLISANNTIQKGLGLDADVNTDHTNVNLVSAAAHNAEVQAAIATTVTLAVQESFMSKTMQDLSKTVTGLQQHNYILATEHTKVCYCVI